MGINFTLTQPIHSKQSTSYTVQACEYGILVHGDIPIPDLVALSKVWMKNGLKHIVPGVGQALGGVIAITGNPDAWIQAIEREVKGKYPDDPQRQWLHGTKTGTSSLAMFSVFARPELQVLAAAKLKGRHDLPSDPDDFMRCSGMVYFLGFENRLEEVSGKWPEWKPIIDNWNKLMNLQYTFEGTPKKPKSAYKKAWDKFYSDFRKAIGK